MKIVKLKPVQKINNDPSKDMDKDCWLEQDFVYTFPGEGDKPKQKLKAKLFISKVPENDQV